MIIFFVLLFFSISLILFVCWMKWKMQHSKAKFAFATVSTFLTCFSTYIYALTYNPITIPAGYLGIDVSILGILKLISLTLVTSLTLFWICKFAKNAITNWHGKPYISEVELAKDGKENSIRSLAYTQLTFFLDKKKDEFASEYAVSWDTYFTPPPKVVENTVLLRDLFRSRYQEAILPDDGWRDRKKLWVGELLNVTSNPEPLYLLVFDDAPSESEVISRVEDAEINIDANKRIHVYGVFMSNDQSRTEISPVEYKGYYIEVLSSRCMIFESIDLKGYAIKLVEKYKRIKVGGTDITLESSYVELNAKFKNNKNILNNSLPLHKILENWEDEDSKRHLAITGEYGQGKSTAMLHYCYIWAKKFLREGNHKNRVPLLIELRGSSPSEIDPLSFISIWCSRYNLRSDQVYNLIKNGEAILIFEGFDELKNSGRPYDRHQHFNALWCFAYPNSKIIFTGRPNFFLDEGEQNNTLRATDDRRNVGDAYTEVLSLEKLDKEQIKKACESYNNNVKDGIYEVIETNPNFLEIISRPSMLPVVATIWDDIEELQKQGSNVTSAILIEQYLQAIYARKEKELENDRVQRDAPENTRYLLLPMPVRELLMICVAWRMSGKNAQNTIPRGEIDKMVNDLYEDIMLLSKKEKVNQEITKKLINFEKKYSETTKPDKIQIITSELCSSGLLIPDPAGGSTNLQFPHKQFYEYLICKGFCIITYHKNTMLAMLIQKSSSNKDNINRFFIEPNSINYLVECVGQKLEIIWSKWQLIKIQVFIINLRVHMKTMEIFHKITEYPLYLIRVIYSKLNYKHSRHSEEYIQRINSFEDEKIELLTKEFIYNIIYEESYKSMYALRMSLMAMFMIIYMFIILPSFMLFSFMLFSFIQIDIIEKYTIIFLILFMFIASMLIIITQMRSQFVRIFMIFLKTHWLKANQFSGIIAIQLIKLAYNSIAKGRVQFPEKPVDDKANIKDHMSLANDFGLQKD